MSNLSNDKRKQELAEAYFEAGYDEGFAAAQAEGVGERDALHFGMERLNAAAQEYKERVEKAEAELKTSDRWREKYYDKCSELNRAEAEIKQMRILPFEIDKRISEATKIAEAQLTAARSLLIEAREALAFYADKKHWEHIAGHTKWASNLKIEDCAMFNTGGGVARKALAKLSAYLDGGAHE